MKYELTQHARKVLQERGIDVRWMERTLDSPEWTTPEPNDPAIERRFRRIPEYGNRVLRVAVNVTVEPNRVVSVFFDRTQKGVP